jgi:molecular chaperone DnaK (HSP70)
MLKIVSEIPKSKLDKIDEVILVGGMTRMPKVQTTGSKLLWQSSKQISQP